MRNSLTRLQTDRLDIVWVHDIAQDFYGIMAGILQPGPHWCLQEYSPVARARVIKAWGWASIVSSLAVTLDLAEAQP